MQSRTHVGHETIVSHDLGNKPVLLMPLNEVSGTIAHDLSGNGNNGTFTGGCTFVTGTLARFPNGGGAVKLDGSTGYVLTGAIGKAAGPATVELWVNPTDVSFNRRIYSQNSGATSQGGAIGFAEGSAGDGVGAGAGSLWTFNGATWARLSADGSIITTTWQHLAFAYSSTQCTAYINGVAQSTATTAFNFSGAMGIGGLFTGSFGTRFSGSFSLVSIYPTALSPDEIKSAFSWRHRRHVHDPRPHRRPELPRQCTGR